MANNRRTSKKEKKIDSHGFIVSGVIHVVCYFADTFSTQGGDDSHDYDKWQVLRMAVNYLAEHGSYVQ